MTPVLPTTELPMFPNEPSQRGPSSEPSKSSVRKEHGHRRTFPPKQPSKLLSKIILDHPNRFGRVQIIFVRFKLAFSGPVQNNLETAKKNWTLQKLLLLDPNDLDGPKSFWTIRRTRQKETYD